MKNSLGDTKIFTDGDVSPVGNTNNEEYIINPPLINNINITDDTTLYLTNNRSFQQIQHLSKTSNKNGFVILGDIIKKKKTELLGKNFKIKSKPPRFCRSVRISLIKCSNGNINEAKFTYIPCNSWTCPDCSLKKALHVKYILKDIILLNNLSYFLTLTLDPKNIPQEYLSKDENNTHKYITKLFNHFITILKRNKVNADSEKLKYIWVIEFQKNGNAHLHILLNKFLPIKEIRKLWVHVGGGHIMKVEKVKSIKGISEYISNYIIKGIKEVRKGNSFKYFERRYSISKSCKRTKQNKSEKWFKDMNSLLIFYELRKLNLEWVYNYNNNFGNEDIIVKFKEDKK